jgi:hypothetical protein
MIPGGTDISPVDVFADIVLVLVTRVSLYW